jgi:hypothetical protein
LIGQPFEKLIVWPAIRSKTRHQRAMTEWDFALLLAFLADSPIKEFTQLIGKKPINYVKNDGHRFGLGYSSISGLRKLRQPDANRGKDKRGHTPSPAIQTLRPWRWPVASVKPQRLLEESLP